MAGSQRYDIAVIGGGIIGLATAMRFIQEFPRRRTIVLEKESAVAQHQTGHNSGVIHAGVYYTPGSQKANFCAAGGAMLRRFADERGIPYEDCGKVIVAANEAERTRLEEVYRRGLANGVKGLEVIDGDRLRELEPHAAGVGAVLSPGTGIIDYDNGVSTLLRCGAVAPRVIPGGSTNVHKRIAVYGDRGFVHWTMHGWESRIDDVYERGEHVYAEEDILGQAAMTEAMIDWLEDDAAVHPLNIDAALSDFSVRLGIYESALNRAVVSLPFTPSSDLVGKLRAALG